MYASHYVRFALLVVLLGVLLGTSSAGEAGKGKALYQQYCSACHGTRGKGDGPAAAAMNPKPRNHTDGSYMNTLSNEHLTKVIADGGQAVQRSPLMPSWKATLDAEQIRDIIAYLRTLAIPPYKP